MSIYEKAHELADLIRNSSEVENMKNAELTMFGDEKARELLQKYSNIQLNIAKTESDLENISEETQKKIADITMEMSKNEIIANYMDSQNVVSQMINNIVSIVGNSLKDESGCGGSCSSCGGGCADF